MKIVERFKDFVEENPESLFIAFLLVVFFNKLNSFLATYSYLVKVVGISIIVTLIAEAAIETDPADWVRDRLLPTGKNEIYFSILMLIAGVTFGTNIALRILLGENLSGLYAASLFGGIFLAFRVYVNVVVDRNPKRTRKTVRGNKKTIEWGKGIIDNRKDTWAIYLGSICAMFSPYGIAYMSIYLGYYWSDYAISAGALVLGIFVASAVYLEWIYLPDYIPWIKYINS